MWVCCETADVFKSEAMQRYIRAQTKRPSKQWVYDIVHKRREREHVIYRDDELGFVLVPCPSDSAHARKGYIAIVYDARLRCLRDLRGSDVLLLQTLKQVCLQRLPDDVTHCSVHYHPSVYQLHVHFRTPAQAKCSEARGKQSVRWFVQSCVPPTKKAQH
jgi:hypothetical protein